MATPTYPGPTPRFVPNRNSHSVVRRRASRGFIQGTSERKASLEFDAAVIHRVLAFGAVSARDTVAFAEQRRCDDAHGCAVVHVVQQIASEDAEGEVVPSSGGHIAEDAVPCA